MAKNYSITELELYGLAINIASFSHFLKKVDFDVIVDHLALTHIIKSKVEPATTRIKRLLELISLFLFNLYYIKGKDMILSDFLSRQTHDYSNPHEIIPISFNMHNVLHEKYYNIGKKQKNIWCKHVLKQSLMELNFQKNLDPNILPEKQHANPINGTRILTEKLHVDKEEQE